MLAHERADFRPGEVAVHHRPGKTDTPLFQQRHLENGEIAVTDKQFAACSQFAEIEIVQQS